VCEVRLPAQVAVEESIEASSRRIDVAATSILDAEGDAASGIHGAATGERRICPHRPV
jgi:hypothetical protein